MTLSPGSKRESKPESIVICLSDILPPQASEIKEITPDRVIPIKNFRVLWCL